jgi:hypothetical protein
MAGQGREIRRSEITSPCRQYILRNYYCFFWVAHRLAALHAGHSFCSIRGLTGLAALPLDWPPAPAFSQEQGVSALDTSHHCDLCCIAKRVFRIRDARRRGKAKKQWPLPNPARPRSGHYEIFGNPSWPKEASRRASVHCLRP